MKSDSRESRRWTRRLGILSLSLFLALLLAELLVRVLTNTGPSLFVQDPAISVRHVRSFDGQHYSEEARRRVPVRFNRDGFRGVDLAHEKDPGVCRVAVLGDSMVAALEVNEEHTMVRRLEALLNESHPQVRWEVMNYGVASSSVGLGWLLYNEVVSNYGPDIVLGVFFPANDLGDISWRVRRNNQIYFDLDERGELVQVHGVSLQSTISRWLNKHSRLYVLQKKALRKMSLDVRADDEMELEKWVNCTRHSEIIEHSWMLTEAIVSALARDVASRESAFALVMMPASEQVYPSRFDSIRARAGEDAEFFDWNHPENQLDLIASRVGVPFFSLAAALRADDIEQRRHLADPSLYIGGFGHLTEAGHNLAAEALHGHLTNEWDPERPSLVDDALRRAGR